MEDIEYSDFAMAVFRLLNSKDGQFVLEELERMFVYTDIVQLDGEVASAMRAGKSQLVRYLKSIWESQKDNK